MNTQYDDPNGDLLARALRAEAETIVPAGDGLSRIRERVDRRRARIRWLLPTASVLTAGALAGAAFGAYHTVAGTDSLRTDFAHQPSSGHTVGPSLTGTVSVPPPVRASHHPSTSPSSTQPSSEPVAATPDISPVWPFDSAGEVALWQQQYASGGASPWHLDAAYTATTFVQNALGLPKQDVVVVNDTTSGRRSGDVALGTRTTESGRTVEFGVVHLVRWGADKDAPWEITRVDNATARIDAPGTDGVVTSPLSVRYTLNGGVEEDVLLSVYDGRGRLAQTHDTVGGGQHSSTLSFALPTTQTGYLVMADIQSGSGTATLTRLAVTPIRFGTAGSSTPVATQQYPPYFVAVSQQRLALYYSQLGGFDRWLTDPQPGGGVSAPDITDDHQYVYFLRGQGTGTQSLMRVKVTGGPEQLVVDGNGGAINAFDVSGSRNELVVYAVTKDGKQDIRWSNALTGDTGSFHIDSLPPTVVALAWAPDGKHFAATVRTGTKWELRVYDTGTTTSVDGSMTTVCGGEGESCSAPSYDAAGNLYFIRGIDATQWELLQYTGHDIKHVSTWTLPEQANPETATVDITPDAYAALIGAPNDEVFRVVEGQATQVSTSAAQPTW